MSNLLKKFNSIIDKIFKNTKLRRTLIVIDSVILVAALVYGIFIFYEYYSNRKLYKNVENLYTVNTLAEASPTPTPANNDNKATPEPQPTATPLEEQKDPKILDSFNNLLTVNEDTVGWIKIDKTNVNYPIVKYPDNEFYLNYNFEKKKSRTGCIFMDFRNKIHPMDRNIILYGHNMKDVSMFHDVVKYKEKDFFKKHDKIIFNTLYQEGVWQVFSVYVTDIKFDYLITDFPTDADFMKYIDIIRSKSKFKTEDIKVTAEDKIITLSTCSYEFEDARTVVHAKLIK